MPPGGATEVLDRHPVHNATKEAPGASGPRGALLFLATLLDPATPPPPLVATKGASRGFILILTHISESTFPFAPSFLKTTPIKAHGRGAGMSFTKSHKKTQVEPGHLIDTALHEFEQVQLGD